MEQKVLKVRSSRNAAQGPPFACSAKIPSTYSYYQTLHFLPHHQDQDKVFCKYSTSHKSCRCTYFLNSPCLFPRRKGKNCFNIQCSEKTKDRKNGNLEKKKSCSALLPQSNHYAHQPRNLNTTILPRHLCHTVTSRAYKEY